jgi:hypothetical protein
VVLIFSSPIKSMVPSSVRHTVVTACGSTQADFRQKSTDLRDLASI